MVNPVPIKGGRYRVWISHTRRRDFPTKQAAKRYADKMNKVRGTTDELIYGLESLERRDLMVALEAVNGDAKLLKQIAFQQMKRQAISESVTIDKAGFELICDQQRRNCRERTWLETKKFIRAFGRGTELVSAVTEAECNNWLDQYKTPAMRYTMLMLLRRFFVFCFKREWVAFNPAGNISNVIIDKPAPKVLSLPDVLRLVRTVERQDKPLLPYLALRLFAGIRNAEAADIGWMHVKPDYIEVRAEMAKTRAQRLVTMSPSLRAWLGTGGELPAEDGQNRIYQCAKACGIELDRNSLRHTFVSYAVPEFGAARTAAEAGNSERMIFEVYRCLVPKKESEAFWNLRPLVSSLPAHLKHFGVESDVSAYAGEAGVSGDAGASGFKSSSA